jgi:hypothetical protein
MNLDCGFSQVGVSVSTVTNLLLRTVCSSYNEPGNKIHSCKVRVWVEDSEIFVIVMLAKIMCHMSP